MVWKKLNLTQQKHTFIDQKNYYYYYTRLAAFFKDNLGKPLGAYQKGKISLDLNEARDDGGFGTAVASAEPYADNLHLVPDR